MNITGIFQLVLLVLAVLFLIVFIRYISFRYNSKMASRIWIGSFIAFVVCIVLSLLIGKNIYYKLYNESICRTDTGEKCIVLELDTGYIFNTSKYSPKYLIIKAYKNEYSEFKEKELQYIIDYVHEAGGSYKVEGVYKNNWKLDFGPLDCSVQLRKFWWANHCIGTEEESYIKNHIR